MKFRYDKNKEKLIVTESETLEYNQMRIWLNRYVKGYKFMPAFKRGVWSGKIDHFHDGQVNQGLWKECLKGLLEIGSKFEIENKSEFPLNRDITLEGLTQFCKEFFKDHKIKKSKDDDTLIDFVPYDYQIETAFKILKNRYCLGEVATSGGKSLILSIVFFYTLTHIDPDAKFLLIVPSITLVTQFYDNLVEYNLGFQEEGEDVQNKNPIDLRIQEIMSDKPRKYSGQGNPNVYIACYQSLAKKKNWPDEFFEQFHTVAVDECLDGESLISMSDGSYKKIKDISAGDSIKTINDDNKIEIKTVEFVHKNMVNSLSEDMYELEMENGRVLKITGNHKVKLTNGTWIRVDSLKEGDDILYIDETTPIND